MNYPKILNEFSGYKITMQNRSLKTADQYCTDVLLLFRFIIANKNSIPLVGEEFDNINCDNCDINFVREIKSEDIYDFMIFCANERNNGPRARARKLSSIKSFYKYLCTIKKVLDENPAKDIEAPQIKPALPKFLSVDECRELLNTVKNDSKNPNHIRDYCIIVIFLNCGIRLAELVSINLTDIDNDIKSMRIIGKGSKERIVYLNDFCKNSIIEYLENYRMKMPVIYDKNALFLARNGHRISRNTVQYLVKKYLSYAGLGYKKMSTHKLRHTAATLLYRTGKVDVRVLKDILGHEQLNTTQIYTHVSNEQMEKAMEENPLAKDN